MSEQRRIYAWVSNGLVHQIIITEQKITDLYAREFVEFCVDVTDASVQPTEGWSATQANGGWKFSAPTPAEQPLTTQAQQVLAQARRHCTQAYLLLNRATPDAWVVYLEALDAIASGTDITSTALPTKPAV